MNDNFQLQDERVLDEVRKIQCKGFKLLIVALFISLMIQLLMDAPFSQYAVEFVLLIGCALYQIVASIHRGFNIWDGKNVNKKQLRVAIFAGIIAVIVFSLVAYKQSWTEWIVFLVVFIPVFYGLRKFLIHQSNKQQEKIDRQFDEDEEDLD